MGTWEADANFKTQLRQDVLNELTGTVGQVFLGFTVGCARCHDHKYDPIPQRDFYRLQAFFAPMRVEDRAAPFSEPNISKADERQSAQVRGRSRRGRRGAEKIEEGLKEKYLEAKPAKAGRQARARGFHEGAEGSEGPIFTAEQKARGTRPAITPASCEMARATVPWPIRFPMSLRRRFPRSPIPMFWPAAIWRIRAKKWRPGFLQAVVGKAEPADIPFAGGSSGRRLALADWIASPTIR